MSSDSESDNRSKNTENEESPPTSPAGDSRSHQPSRFLTKLWNFQKGNSASDRHDQIISQASERTERTKTGTDLEQQPDAEAEIKLSRRNVDNKPLAPEDEHIVPLAQIQDSLRMDEEALPVPAELHQAELSRGFRDLSTAEATVETANPVTQDLAAGGEIIDLPEALSPDELSPRTEIVSAQDAPLDETETPRPIAARRDSKIHRKAALEAYERMKEEQRLKSERGNTIRLASGPISTNDPSDASANLGDVSSDETSPADRNYATTSSANLDPVVSRQSFVNTVSSFASQAPVQAKSETFAQLVRRHSFSMILVAALVAAGIAYYPTGNAHSNLSAGEELLAKGDPQGAIEKLTKAIDMIDKQNNLADDDYQKAAQIAPVNAVMQKKLLASNDLTRKAKPASLSDSKQSVTLAPALLKEIAEADLETLKQKGYQALRSNHVEYAVAALSRAVHLNQNDGSVRRYLAYAMLKTGNTSEAAQQFYAWEKITTPDPQTRIEFVKSMATQADVQILFEHLAQEYRTNVVVLLEIARQCAFYRYNSAATTTLNLATKVASTDQQVAINRLRSSIDHSSTQSSTAPPTPGAVSGSKLLQKAN